MLEEVVALLYALTRVEERRILSGMNKARVLKALPLVFLVLTACVSKNGGKGLCPSSRAVEGVLAPACSSTQPEPLASPVGSWRGTLTTITGGSGTEPFAAEITEVAAVDADYAGVFTVGNEVYNVTGVYNGTNDEGDIFVFKIPLEELQPAVSPAR